MDGILANTFLPSTSPYMELAAQDDVISLEGGISGDPSRQASTRQSLDSITFRPIAEEPAEESLGKLAGCVT